MMLDVLSQDNFIPRSANTPPIKEFSSRPGILSSIRAEQEQHKTSIFANFYLPSCFTSAGQMFAGPSILLIPKLLGFSFIFAHSKKLMRPLL